MAMYLCRRGGALILESFPPSTYSASSFSYLSPSVRPAIALTKFPNRFPSTTIIGAAATTEDHKTTTSSSLNDDPQSNWKSRTPRLKVFDDLGLDYEHWTIVMEKPPGEPTRDDIIATYINTLSKVLESEEEARMKIYWVSTRYQFAFGALISEELRYKIGDLPGVRWVFPDVYLDAKNKDYGGEPFINGKAVPYDPKYDKKWGPWNFYERDMEEEEEERDMEEEH